MEAALLHERRHLPAALLQVRRAYEDLRKRRLDEFMAGFNCISLKLKEMYQMITLGGDAELELVDSLDPFSEVGCSEHLPAAPSIASCWYVRANVLPETLLRSEAEALCT